MDTEWLVLRDGRLWSDRFRTEAECIFHIQECVENDEQFCEDDYEYRRMTEEEIRKYEENK